MKGQTSHTNHSFVTKARSIHGDRYDYSLVEYVNYETPVTIICSSHGNFLQTPRIHLVGQSDCQKCALEENNKSKYLTQEEFVSRARKMHGDKYDYSESMYIDHKTKVKIRCDACGRVFKMRPSIHIYGQGCPPCGDLISGTRLTQEEFVDRLQQRYGDRFSYDKAKYGTNYYCSVTLTCKEHGDFTKQANILLSSEVACPECIRITREDKTNRLGGYNLSNVMKDPLKSALFYVVLFENDEERFYKVGVTVQLLHRRFPKMRVCNYRVTPVEVKQTTLIEAFTLEQNILQRQTHASCRPKQKFNGYRECFSINPLIREAGNLQ